MQMYDWNNARSVRLSETRQFELYFGSAVFIPFKPNKKMDNDILTHFFDSLLTHHCNQPSIIYFYFFRVV